ncbi:stage V sporulation protein AC [Clostridium sp. Marseille-P299]|uniref:stage V sporulation protein AC n=1 Tax=Clostridium sp. Marseille-P299 TaxID=1805477 RepID=UPI0008342533|nr:stage V sporulation protein AC [Clostridium sp. Marseille-P299]
MSDENKKVTISQVEQESNKTERDKLYNQYVKQVTPKHSWFLNLIKAFISGGIICAIGQGFTNFYMARGAEKELAGAYTTLSLVLLAVLLTGFNVYQKIAKFAGAGSVVPITGFANSVAAPAIEFKKEGQVFGIGCKIFTIAGPVILYGIFSSFILGVIYYIFQKI